MDYADPFNVIEVIGVLTGLACVWLAVRQSVWTWPITIVSASLFLVLFLESRLYANVGLQCFFIALAIYGWYEWIRGGDEGSGLLVSRLTGKTALVLLSIVIAGTVILAIILDSSTDAAELLLDSLATVMSLVAQWMLARKILETWFVWIAADVVFVGLFVSTELYLTVALYLVFMGMCVVGYVQWQRTLQWHADASHDLQSR